VKNKGKIFPRHTQSGQSRATLDTTDKTEGRKKRGGKKLVCGGGEKKGGGRGDVLFFPRGKGKKRYFHGGDNIGERRSRPASPVGQSVGREIVDPGKIRSPSLRRKKEWGK